MAWSEDPTDFLTDFGVSVTADGVTGLGILDMPGEYVADGRVITNEYQLRVESSKFGALSYGDSVTVDGDAYTVREAPIVADDGIFCVMLLTKDTATLAPPDGPDVSADFLQDFGVSITAAGTSSLGILDAPGEYVADGRVITDEYVLRAESALFGGLTYGDSITVDSQSYTVREAPLLVDDGMFCLVLLTKTALGHLLLEDGFDILQETGFNLLVEA
jgi:riboflavin synthase alpha subunit